MQSVSVNTTQSIIEIKSLSSERQTLAADILAAQLSNSSRPVPFCPASTRDSKKATDATASRLRLDVGVSVLVRDGAVR